MTSAQRQIPIVCPGHSRPIAELHYSTSNSDAFLLSACHDKLPMLRHADTGNWIGTFEGHKGAVWSAQLNQDATLAATGSADFSVKIWDAISGQLQRTIEHNHIVKSVAFTPSGKKLLTAGHEKILRIFDLEMENDCLEAEIALPEKTRKVLATSDRIAVTGHVNGRVCVWDMKTHELKHSFSLDLDTSHGVMDMECSNNNATLTIAAGNKDFAFVSSFTMPISFEEEGGASLHPSGKRFIAGGSDTYVRVFDAETGEVLECHKGHHGPVRCLRYSPLGTTFATGSEDGTIRIWQSAGVREECLSNADSLM